MKRLFIKIYEDNASGRLSDDRFDMLSLTYEREQKQLENECVTLWQETEVQERQNENIEKFIQTAHKYVGIDELDGYALRELVSNNGNINFLKMGNLKFPNLGGIIFLFL